jgi:hypothetical protein
MEKEFYTDEFEQLIKEKADQFRMYPSKRVWHSIYNNLHPSRRWPSVIMSLLLITSLMLIGYLHTGDNSINRQVNDNASKQPSDKINITQNTDSKKNIPAYSKVQQQPATVYDNAFEDLITGQTDVFTYTVVRNNRPINFFSQVNGSDALKTTDKTTLENNDNNIIQTMDSYIKSGKILADVTGFSKKSKVVIPKVAVKNTYPGEPADNNTTEALNNPASLNPAPVNTNKPHQTTLAAGEKNTIAKINTLEGHNALTNEEKAWIENYALQNKPGVSKWKGRLAYQFYITPAVNYRKLSTNSKGSATPFANSDINNSISQKPGFGIESGVGLTYSFAKKIQLKAGVQFNYTNYNINADETNHPIITTILLNDPATGYSYSAARTSTTSNAFNSAALQPVTLHNRTYQISSRARIMLIGLPVHLFSQPMFLGVMHILFQLI